MTGVLLRLLDIFILISPFILERNVYSESNRLRYVPNNGIFGKILLQ